MKSNYCKGGLIDLHVHTTCSDGKLSPLETLTLAKKNGVEFLSITDHYNLGPCEEIYSYAKDLGINLIPGAEISCDATFLKSLAVKYPPKLHLLIYYPEPNIMLPLLDTYEVSREESVKKSISYLNSMGYNFSFEDIQTFSNKESIGRIDLARFLVYKKICKSVNHAFASFLDKKCAISVQRKKPSVEEIIPLLLKAGGVPVLAHPLSLHLEPFDLRTLLKYLSSLGLQGVEVYNPHHLNNFTRFLQKTAKEFNLISTVGSDFHGRNGNGIEIGLGINGNLCHSDYTIIERLEKRKDLIYTDYISNISNISNFSLA